MRRLRDGALATETAALVLATLAAPAAAVEFGARLTVLQGLPGNRFEVCLDGERLAGKLRYARRKTRAVAPGPHTLKDSQA